MSDSVSVEQRSEPANVARRRSRHGPFGRVLPAVLGANERVGLGFIGFGLIGKRHVLDFRDQPDARIVAIAEVHRGRRDEAVALAGGSRPGLRRLSGPARRPRRRRRGRLDARPLARPDDHDGLRGGQGRVCREAADPVRPRGAVDGRRRPAAQPGRPGRHAAAIGASLPESARAGPRRPDRPGRRGPDVVLPQRHARLRLASRWRPAAGTRLRHVARSRPEAAVQPEPRDLPLPMVLGLFRRADDQPRPALARHRALVPGRHGPDGRHQRGRAVRLEGQRRDARHAGRSVRIPGLDRHVVAPRVQPRRGPGEGAGVLRDAGEPQDLAQGICRDARPQDRPGRRDSPVRRSPPGRRPGHDRPARGAGERGPASSRTGPATSSTSSSATPATSSIASGLAATRSRTWRARTASPPLATWRTCRSAWAGSCAGTPSARRSSATPRPRPCSNGRTGRPGTPNAMPSFGGDDSCD